MCPDKYEKYDMEPAFNGLVVHRRHLFQQKENNYVGSMMMFPMFCVVNVNFAAFQD